MRMPALFLGHGNPMNALSRNAWTEGWAALGRSLPRPRAILAVSAHWYGRGLAVTAMERPRTIHDFGGFPPELFAFDYPAPGSPSLAARVRDLLAPLPVAMDESWGLDHGTWSVLCHAYPGASVPVVQLRIDATQPPSFHHALGTRLAPLREEGVLLLGSGNLVHNLREYAWGAERVAPLDWAVRFERHARELILSGDHGPLVDYGSLGPDARLAIPTPDHYLPLLTVLGAQGEGDATRFPVEGVDGGSISMLGVAIGS